MSTQTTTTQAASEAEGLEAWRDLAPQEVVRRTRCEATVFKHATDISLWRECCDLILNRLGPKSIAAAPVTGAEGAGRDFELMLARIIHRHGKGLDITDTIAGARNLLACKGSMSPLREETTAPQPAGAERVDLVSYLERQWAWSKETFGPALRTKGIVQHITKELREIEAEPHDLAEWVDVIILAMDGFWRHGGKPEDLLPAMQAKQDRNFARTWPDWRTMGEDQAIEHDRSGEVPASLPAALGRGEGTAGATPGPNAIEAAAQAYYDGMIGRVEDQWPHHDGWAGKSWAFKAKVRAHMARALEAASLATPHPQSPSLPEVEEDALSRAHADGIRAANWTLFTYEQSLAIRQKYLPAALATLTASQEQDGEVRHG